MTVRPLEHVNPVIRGVYWNLHRLVSDALSDRLPPGWTLFPVFHTRVSCVLNPDLAPSRADGDIIKDTTLDYVAIALYAPVAGKDANRQPVPLIAIDLTHKAPRDRPPPDLLESAGLPYMLLNEQGYEEAESRIAAAVHALDVPKALSRRYAVDFLHHVERRIFWSLVRAGSSRNLVVLGQTSLPQMVDLSDEGPIVDALRQSRVAPWQEMLRYLRRHPVDFVLCSGAPYGLPCILIALEGTQKNSKNPKLGQLKRAEQDAVVAASGLTLCRVHWDSRYLTHDDDEMRDLAEALASITREWVDSGDFTQAVRTRVAQPLGELAGKSTHKKQIAQDVLAILQYQAARISALEAEGSVLRGSLQERDREIQDLESQVPPVDPRWSDHERVLYEMHLEESLTAHREQGVLPSLADLGLLLHTSEARDPIDGMPSLFAELKWAEPPPQPAPPLPKPQHTPIKVEFTGAWQQACSRVYKKAAEHRLLQRLQTSLARNPSPWIEHRIRMLSAEQQKRAQDEIDSAIGRTLEIHRTPIAAQSALLTAIDQGVPLWAASSLRMTLVSRWRKAVLHAPLPASTRENLLHHLATIANAPQTTPPDPPDLGE